jgi:hypothetical protein
MKKQLTVLGLVLLITAIGCQWLTIVQAAPTMTTQVVDSQGADSTLYLDAQNNPHIFFHEQVMGDLNPCNLSYAESTGEKWVVQEVAGTPGNVFIMDSANRPHIISVVNGILNDTPITGFEWNFRNMGISNVADNKMIMDSSGTLHAVYVNTTYLEQYRENYTEFLRYSTWTNTGQVTRTLEETNSTTASFHRLIPIAIALDSSGNPQIVFLERLGNATKIETEKLMYAWWTGTGWSIQTIGGGSSDIGAIGNLFLDSNDQPHLFYFYGSLLYYAYLNGTNWVNQPVESKINSALDEHPPALVLDSNSIPLVFFFKENYDRVGDIFLASAKWTGTDWSIERVGNLSGSLNGWSPKISNIALDGSGNPHFSYSTAYSSFRSAPVYSDLTYVFIEVNSSLTPILILVVIAGTVIVSALVVFMVKRKKSKNK